MSVNLVKSEDSQFLAWSRNFNRAQVEGVVARTSKIDLAGRVFGRKPIDPGFYRQFVSHDPSPLVRRPTR